METAEATKPCPACMEPINARAHACKFCGHKFEAPWPAAELLKLAFCCVCSFVVGAVAMYYTLRDPILKLKVDAFFLRLGALLRGEG